MRVRAPSISQSGSCSTMEPIHSHSPLSAPPISAEMALSPTSDAADPHSMDEDDEMGELWADRIYPAMMGKNHRLISTGTIPLLNPSKKGHFTHTPLGSLIMDLMDCHGHTAVVSKRIQDNVLEHPQVSPQQRERMGMVIKAQKCVRDLLLDLIKEFGKDKACTEEYNQQVLREAPQGQLAREGDGQEESQDMVDVDGDDTMQD
jgi:hypothetical protein